MENLGNIITLLTLILTTILGISDIKRRRAEAKKMESESSLTLGSRDTQMMSQIKQASIDLVLQIKSDNEQLRKENEELRTEIDDLRVRLEKCERCLRNGGKDCGDEI